MAEYINREALYRRVKERTNPYGKPTLDYKSGVEVMELIKQALAADVVEVVRCKECKRYEEAEYDGGSKYVCRLLKRQMQPDDFCSYGERKGGEGE